MLALSGNAIGFRPTGVVWLKSFQRDMYTYISFMYKPSRLKSISLVRQSIGSISIYFYWICNAYAQVYFVQVYLGTGTGRLRPYGPRGKL